MKKYFFLLILIFLTSESHASVKKQIIQNLEGINNISFNFEQNINEKSETGNCTIQYPKKIHCKYNSNKKKILVSNGKSLVIKSIKSYYIYPLNKTPLNYILDKDFLIKKISNLRERNIDNKYINFNFVENDMEINIFFDKKSFNLIGWQTIDIYQNLSITFLSSVQKNQDINKNLFILPKQN